MYFSGLRMNSAILVKMAVIFLALLSFISCSHGQSLRMEHTDSFSVVGFRWTGDCNSSYSLDCQPLTLPASEVIIAGFIPLDTGIFNCFFQAFGFSANNSYNCSIRGNFISQNFESIETIPVFTLSEAPSPPEYLHFYDLTWSSVSLVWDPPTRNRDSVAGYNVRVISGSTYNTLNTSYTIPNLNPSRSYTVQVRAFYRTSSGTQIYGNSESVIFTTPTDAPQILNVPSGTITTSSAFIIWAPPSTNADLVSQYEVRQNNIFIAYSVNTYYNMTGLASSASYLVSVVALTSVLSRPRTSQSNFWSFRTLSRVTQILNRPTINVVTPSNRSTSSVSISWIHSSSSTSSPTHFDATIYPLYDLSGSLASNRFIAGNRRNFDISGLESQLSYRLSLSATNSAGSGPAASAVIPPFLPNPSADVVQSRRRYMQLLLSGTADCSRWLANIQRNILAQGLLKRLATICPSCNDFSLSRFPDLTTYCSQSSKQILFQAEVASASTSCGGCNFNQLLEFFVSLSNPHIVAGESFVLLVDTKCPLYVSSKGNTNCLTSSVTSSGSVVGGTIGGMIAGAIIAAVIVIIIFVAVLLYKKKKPFSKKEDELSPHPMTHTYKGKTANNDNAEDGEYYEDMVAFNKSMSEEVNYEDPNAANRSKAFSVSDGYEVPDCGSQNVQNSKTKSSRKESGKKKSAKGGSPGGGNKKVKVPPKPAAPPIHESDIIEDHMTASQQANMYSHAPEGTGSSKQKAPSPTQWQQMHTPLLPVGGKKLAIPPSAGSAPGTGGRGESLPPMKPKPKVKDKPAIGLQPNIAYHTHARN